MSTNITRIFILLCIINLSSCQTETIKNIRKKINIKNLFGKLKKEKALDKSDTTNIFDADTYDPSKMDSAEVLKAIETIYEGDSSLIKKIGADDSGILGKHTQDMISDTVPLQQDSFSSDIKKINPQELKALKYNLDQLKANTQLKPLDSNARQKQCKIWADVSKKDQRLYLYVEGELVDTFKVSSGDRKHETPHMDRRPSGPQFQKYTSKKYPGGNYSGLGNMPYVLFVQGGYGLHGTTIGNIKRLGTKASHGCIRLHPDNAKILFELVKAVGIENTWVTIRE